MVEQEVKYTIHPACADLPRQSPEEDADLEASMIASGQLLPIIKYGTLIIDGRHRFRIALKLKMVPWFEEFVPFSDEPSEIEREIYDRVKALHTRRNMSTGQWTQIVNRWVSRGAITPIPRTAGDPVRRRPITNSEIAKAAGKDRRSIQRANTVENRGVEELKELMADDKVSLRAAEKLSKLPEQDQQAAVERIKSGEEAPDVVKDIIQNSDHSRLGLKDENDRSVPSKFINAFAERGKFSGISARISQIKKDVEELHAGPAGDWMLVNSIVADLVNAGRFVRGAAPHAICPYCLGAQKINGQKCEPCKGRGWVTKQVYEQAPESIKGA